jgi:Fe-S-cluster containining protein
VADEVFMAPLSRISCGPKVDFTYPVNIQFNCHRCGLCCGDTKQKNRHILLLEVEAKKIASHTSRLIPDFSVEIKDMPPYVYEMKKTSEGKCVYFKDNECSIYLLRPLICMFYPFELKFDEQKRLHNFDFTLECPGINKGKVFHVNDFKKLFDLAQERLL